MFVIWPTFHILLYAALFHMAVVLHGLCLCGLLCIKAECVNKVLTQKFTLTSALSEINSYFSCKSILRYVTTNGMFFAVAVGFSPKNRFFLESTLIHLLL